MTVHNRTNEPKTVEVELIDYNAERGFGFAIDYENRDADRVPAKIFFHATSCRKVGGTPKKPVLLTKQRTTHTFAPTTLRQRMLMQYVDGPRGPRATAWGIPPTRTAITDLMEDGGVRRFIGGTVSLFNVRQQNDYYSGTVLAATLVPGYLQLELDDAYVNGRRMGYSVIVQVDLWEASGSPVGDAEYSLSGYVGSRHMRTSFRLPKQGS